MSAPSFLDLFRTLSSFSPERVSLRGGPWEDYVPWVIANGLGPLASYNLEYRLPASGAPQWARGQLASIYQGTANDNVLKLVMFKRTVTPLEGRRFILMGGAIFAEALYPHIAFRPVIELQVLLKSMDVEPFAGFLGKAEFKPAPEDADFLSLGPTKVLTDGSTPILLFSDVLGANAAAATKALFERALPTDLYGPSVFRPTAEDALLLEVLAQARQGYAMPYLSFVDLRELVLGAPVPGRPVLHPRATPSSCAPPPASGSWSARCGRASPSSSASTPRPGRPWPRCSPSCAHPTRALLNRAVVDPLSDPSLRMPIRGADRLRRLLTGGR